MAIQLFKLASEAFPNISSTTSQAAHAYFRTVSTGGISIATGVNYSLEVSTWDLSNGNSATIFATGQGSTSLCVNGILQQPGLYTVNTGAVVITPVDSAVSINSGTPITLQTYNTSVSVTVSTLASTLIAIP